MRVVRAEALGMCFGVRDALALMESIERPSEVTIHGELVHNPAVTARLDERGFRRVDEASRGANGAGGTPLVLITAHGVSNAERARLEGLGKELVDTTCPLVTRAHRAALALQAQGYFVVVIGRPGHVEVDGLTGDLAESAVVARVEDARDFGRARLGVICQTTTPPDVVEAVHRAIVRANPKAEEIRLVDTVCRPTKQRQTALARLFAEVDAVVVVGGRNSNNTRALVGLCEEAGVRAWQVENAREVDADWFEGMDVVGLTAGTSTLDATVDAVQARLERIGRPLRAATLSGTIGVL